MGLKALMDKFNYWYFSYTILSNVYFLEPVERWVCNALLVFFIALVLYTTYVYLPGHSLMMLHFFQHVFGVDLDLETTAASETE